MQRGSNQAAVTAFAAMLLLAAAPALAFAAETGQEAGSPMVGMIAKLFNFAILAGTLVYFLRSPIAVYLRDRGTRIRSDLVKAAAARAEAAARLAAIDQKMAALPAELNTLRTAGAEELAAEDARIRQVADAERSRLLEQARREIDWQLKLAQTALVNETADLAVAIAARRVKSVITAQDQARLVDEYLGQLGRTPTAAGRGRA